MDASFASSVQTSSEDVLARIDELVFELKGVSFDYSLLNRRRGVAKLREVAVLEPAVRVRLLRERRVLVAGRFAALLARQIAPIVLTPKELGAVIDLLGHPERKVSTVDFAVFYYELGSIERLRRAAMHRATGVVGSPKRRACLQLGPLKPSPHQRQEKRLPSVFQDDVTMTSRLSTASSRKTPKTARRRQLLREQEQGVFASLVDINNVSLRSALTRLSAAAVSLDFPSSCSLEDSSGDFPAAAGDFRRMALRFLHVSLDRSEVRALENHCSSGDISFGDFFFRLKQQGLQAVWADLVRVVTSPKPTVRKRRLTKSRNVLLNSLVMLPSQKHKHHTAEACVPASAASLRKGQTPPPPLAVMTRADSYYSDSSDEDDEDYEVLYQQVQESMPGGVVKTAVKTQQHISKLDHMMGNGIIAAFRLKRLETKQQRLSAKMQEIVKGTSKSILREWRKKKEFTTMTNLNETLKVCGMTASFMVIRDKVQKEHVKAALSLWKAAGSFRKDLLVNILDVTVRKEVAAARLTHWATTSMVRLRKRRRRLDGAARVVQRLVRQCLDRRRRDIYEGTRHEYDVTTALIIIQRWTKKISFAVKLKKVALLNERRVQKERRPAVLRKWRRLMRCFFMLTAKRARVAKLFWAVTLIQTSRRAKKFRRMWAAALVLHRATTKVNSMARVFLTVTLSSAIFPNIAMRARLAFFAGRPAPVVVAISRAVNLSNDAADHPKIVCTAYLHRKKTKDDDEDQLLSSHGSSISLLRSGSTSQMKKRPSTRSSNSAISDVVPAAGVEGVGFRDAATRNAALFVQVERHATDYGRRVSCTTVRSVDFDESFVFCVEPKAVFALTLCRPSGANLNDFFGQATLQLPTAPAGDDEEAQQRRRKTWGNSRTRRASMVRPSASKMKWSSIRNRKKAALITAEKLVRKAVVTRRSHRCAFSPHRQINSEDYILDSGPLKHEVELDRGRQLQLRNKMETSSGVIRMRLSQLGSVKSMCGELLLRVERVLTSPSWRPCWCVLSPQGFSVYNARGDTTKRTEINTDHINAVDCDIEDASSIKITVLGTGDFLFKVAPTESFVPEIRRMWLRRLRRACSQIPKDEFHVNNLNLALMHAGLQPQLTIQQQVVEQRQQQHLVEQQQHLELQQKLLEQQQEQREQQMPTTTISPPPRRLSKSPARTYPERKKKK